MAKPLELIVDSYSSPSSREPDAHTIPRVRGQRFEPLDDQERDRLIEIGAAVDPQEAQKQREAALQAEKEQIEARRAALDAELEALDSGGPAGPLTVDGVDDLKGKALDSELESRSLSKDGTADEKRDRLREAVAAEQGT